jgi:hypothetical protein
MFNTQFLAELNNESISSDDGDVSETCRQSQIKADRRPQAIQYIQTKKPEQFDNILNLISRIHDDSKVLCSRMDTQFSEIPISDGHRSQLMTSFL